MSLGAGGASFLAACGSGATPGGPRPGSEAVGGEVFDDVAVLNSALDLEHIAIAAYRAGLPRLSGSIEQAGRHFLGHEEEHAQALARAIRDLHGTPDRPRASYDFPRLRTQVDVLRFASMVERTAIAAYIDALPKLNEPQLRSTGAAIAADEAEHLAVLRQALGQDPAPNAFVIGATAS